MPQLSFPTSLHWRRTARPLAPLSAIAVESFLLQSLVAPALLMLMLGVSDRLLLGPAWLAFVVRVAYTALVVVALQAA
ncbi:MAG: hypothetical protein R3E68_01495 [Burkholderiaceae bacterium]